MNKHSLLVLLAGVNLLLLAAILLVAWDLPQAQAQPVGGGQNYLVCTGAISTGVDVLYVIDVTHRRLHAFVPNRDLANRRMFHAGVRDLAKDFR